MYDVLLLSFEDADLNKFIKLIVKQLIELTVVEVGKNAKEITLNEFKETCEEYRPKILISDEAFFHRFKYLDRKTIIPLEVRILFLTVRSETTSNDMRPDPSWNTDKYLCRPFDVEEFINVMTELLE